MNCERHEDQELVSAICGAAPVGELDTHGDKPVGFCGHCREGDVFGCPACENEAAAA